MKNSSRFCRELGKYSKIHPDNMGCYQQLQVVASSHEGLIKWTQWMQTFRWIRWGVKLANIAGARLDLKP